MDTTKPVLRFEEGFTSLPPQLQKESIVGGPVTCVAFRSSSSNDNTQAPCSSSSESDTILVARGPFLEQHPVLLSDKNEDYHHSDTTAIAAASPSSRHWRCLAFPDGGTIHGIRLKSNLCVAFGGRQIAILYPENHHHHHHGQQQQEKESSCSLTPLPIRIGLEPLPSQQQQDQFHNSATSFGTNPSLCLTDVFGSKRMTKQPSFSNNKSSGKVSSDGSIWLDELDTPTTSTSQLSSANNYDKSGSIKQGNNNNSYLGMFTFDGNGGLGAGLDSTSLWLSNSLSSPSNQQPFQNTTGNTTTTAPKSSDPSSTKPDPSLSDEDTDSDHGPSFTLTVSDLIWDVQLFADKSQKTSKKKEEEIREYTMVVAMAQNSCDIWKIIGSEESCTDHSAKKNIVVRVERLQHVVCSIRCITYCMSIYQRQQQHQQEEDTNSDIIVVAGTVFNEVLVWTAWSFDQEEPHMNSPGKTTQQRTRPPFDLKKFPSTLRLECSSFAEEEEEDEETEEKSLDSVFLPQNQQSQQHRRQSVDHRLVGHEGVIHSVKVLQQRNDGSTFIASTSDDRTVRLWKQTSNKINSHVGIGDDVVKKGSNDFILQWTGYGHTARVWDVSFCYFTSFFRDNTDNCQEEDQLLLVSAGEDGTARIWNMTDGTQCGDLRGNGGSVSLWKVDTLGSLIVAGSNDGTAKIWNLRTYVRAIDNVTSCSDNSSSDEGIRDNTLSCNQVRAATGQLRHSCQVPDDNIQTFELEKAVEELSLTDTNTEDAPAAPVVLEGPPGLSDNNAPTQKGEKKKRKKEKNAGQVIFGMKFFHKGSNNWPEKILVATRAGSLFSFDFYEKTWAEHKPWFTSGTSEGTKHSNLSSWDGTCMGVSKSGDVIAIGTSKGYILVTYLQPKGAEGSSNDSSLNCGTSNIILEARDYKTTQGIIWKNKSTLVSFHIKGIIILWEFQTIPTPLSIGTTRVEVSRLVFDMGTVGIPLCFATDVDDKRLLTGDSRGNIGVFDMDSVVEDDKIPPTQVVTRAHGKEHVNAIVCCNGGSIVSVGNDGCVREYCFNSDGALQKTLSVPTAFLSSLSNIWVVQKEGGGSSTVIIGGYHGNSFVVLDVSLGYEILRVDTGGRHRQQDCFLDFRSSSLCEFPLAYHIAILSQNKNKHEINFQSYHSKQVAERTNFNFQYSIGVGIHSETIFDLCFCETAKSNYSLLSGSEDNGAKLSTYKNGTLTHSKNLQPHESCVRAVCCSRDVFSSSASSLLVTCGGKLTVKFYILDHYNQASQHRQGGDSVRFLGPGSFPSKPSIDQRINAVEAIALMPPTNEQQQGTTSAVSHLVIAGDSNGCVYLFQISQDANSPNSSMMSHKLYEGARPVLSINILRVRKKILFFVGTTGGTILVWDLPGSVFSWEDIAISRNGPLFEYDAHQMGTNCVTSTFLSNDKQNPDTATILICSGGDDQAITVCKASVNFVKTHNSASTHDGSESPMSSMKILQLFVAREASISAIKGIRLVGKDRILSVGYGQRVALWKIMGKKEELALLSSAPVDVSDVNCLAFASSSSSYNGSVHSNNSLGKNVDKEEGEIVAVGGEGIELFSF